MTWSTRERLKGTKSSATMKQTSMPAKGAAEEDRRLNGFADLYSHRQRFYAHFMKRIKKSS